MLDLETAQERILSVLSPRPVETVRVQNALGRVLAQDVVAPLDLPAFDNSAMDGFALRAADLIGASASAPVRLRCAARVAAGEVFAGELGQGECAPISTGAALPAGADAVVMIEDTRPVEGDASRREFREPVQPGENVRRRGEDVTQGTRLLTAGQRVNLGALALLGAVGLGSIRAAVRPRVGLLATGSELVEAGEPRRPGTIFESNRAPLAALLTQAGAATRMFPLVPDTFEATRAALEKALADCDAVVTSGGVSVGEMDFVKRAFEELGGSLDFWRVAIRPGKPFVFGRCGERYLFGLPGNPVSALVTCLLLVRPAILRMQGATEVGLRSHPGVLVEAMANSGDRRHFARVRMDDRGGVRLAGRQASHALRHLAETDGLVDMPPGTDWPAGQSVQVLRWDG